MIDNRKMLKIKEVLSILLIPFDEDTVLYKALDELYELGYDIGRDAEHAEYCSSILRPGNV